MGENIGNERSISQPGHRKNSVWTHHFRVSDLLLALPSTLDQTLLCRSDRQSPAISPSRIAHLKHEIRRIVSPINRFWEEYPANDNTQKTIHTDVRRKCGSREKKISGFGQGPRIFGLRKSMAVRCIFIGPHCRYGKLIYCNEKNGGELLEFYEITHRNDEKEEEMLYDIGERVTEGLP